MHIRLSVLSFRNTEPFSRASAVKADFKQVNTLERIVKIFVLIFDALSTGKDMKDGVVSKKFFHLASFSTRALQAKPIPLFTDHFLWL